MHALVQAHKDRSDISSTHKDHLDKLFRKVMRDKDRHFTIAGSWEKNRCPAIRARHLVSALKNHQGSNIKYTDDGLLLSAPRHAGEDKKAGENYVHSWLTNGDNILKFSETLNGKPTNHQFVNDLSHKPRENPNSVGASKGFVTQRKIISR